MKRTRDRLTGGTNDVNPQTLTFTATTITANTYQEGQISIPITRVGSVGKGKAIIVELLKAWFQLPELDQAPQGQRSYARCQISTVPLHVAGQPGLGIDYDNPRVLAYVQRSWLTFMQAGGVLQTTTNDPLVWDWTDNAGHGILVAAETLYLGCDTVNFLTGSSFHCKILYRFKEVGLEEYIGLVQSQQ